jgi:hypothetical protein
LPFYASKQHRGWVCRLIPFFNGAAGEDATLREGEDATLREGEDATLREGEDATLRARPRGVSATEH